METERTRYPFPRFVAKSIAVIITNIHHFSREGCSEFPPLFTNSLIFSKDYCQFHLEGFRNAYLGGTKHIEGRYWKILTVLIKPCYVICRKYSAAIWENVPFDICKNSSGRLTSRY